MVTGQKLTWSVRTSVASVWRAILRLHFLIATTPCASSATVNGMATAAPAFKCFFIFNFLLEILKLLFRIFEMVMPWPILLVLCCHSLRAEIFLVLNICITSRTELSTWVFMKCFVQEPEFIL